MRFLYALLAAGLGAGGAYMFTDIGENWFTPTYLTRLDSGAHGYIFDAEGQEVALDNAEIIELQAELYDDALQAELAEPDDSLMQLAEQVQERLAEGNLTEDQTVYLRAAIEPGQIGGGKPILANIGEHIGTASTKARGQ